MCANIIHRVTLPELLEASARLHHHLCPRQVLGVRLGLYAGELLNLELPQTTKRLYVVMETDGCAADGVSAATNCWVGRRTLRVEDYGKVAATFIDTQVGEALRLAPSPQARGRAVAAAPETTDAWQAQLWGYQRVPSEQLFTVQRVQLHSSLEKLISQPGLKVLCTVCGEEIMNEREVHRAGATLCCTCAGEGYYTVR